MLHLVQLHSPGPRPGPLSLLPGHGLDLGLRGHRPHPGRRPAAPLHGARQVPDVHHLGGVPDDDNPGGGEHQPEGARPGQNQLGHPTSAYKRTFPCLEATSPPLQYAIRNQKGASKDASWVFECPS